MKNHREAVWLRPRATVPQSERRRYCEWAPSMMQSCEDAPSKAQQGQSNRENLTLETEPTAEYAVRARLLDLVQAERQYARA